MRSTEKDIANEYKKMIKHLEREVGRSGVVKSVDEAAQTALVQLTIHDKDENVRVVLNATPDSDMGINIYPAVDSDVVVCDVDGDGIYTIIQYGKIDKVIIKTGDDAAELEVSAGTVVMNGGENGGVVKVQALVDKINAIEDLLKDLITQYNAHTHPYIPGPGTVTSPTLVTTSLETGTIATNTSVDDLKNDHVKH